MDLKDLGLQKIKFNHRNRRNEFVTKEGDKGTRGLLIEFDKGLRCKCYIEGVVQGIEGVEVEEGLYEVVYPSSLKKGITPLEIKFYDGDGILSSCIYDVRVYRSLEEV